MKAAAISKYGHNEKLKVIDVPQPEPAENEVLIEVYAASVNPIDFKIRDGLLRVIRPYKFPLVLGHDLAGRIAKIGAKVTKFKVGDDVYSRPNGDRMGSFAEFVVAPEDEVALKPKSLSFSQAASIPLVGLTSYQSLVDTAQLKEGQHVFIQAGSGGIGTFAIQLAKLLGAKVSTTTSEKNCELVSSLGADRIIDYKREAFDKVLDKVDVVFDTLGGESLDRSFSIVNEGGWVVSIAGTPDHKTARDLNLNSIKTALFWLIGRKANRLAAKAKAHYRYLFMHPSGRELAQIARWIDEGKIKPVIDSEFSLNDAQLAMERSESGRARGKIIVRVR